jgi:CRISPR-associated protein Csb1
MSRYENILGIPRLKIEAQLAPLQGNRFSASSFPNIGAAYYYKDGKKMVTVETNQAVANLCEGAMLGPDHIRLKDELKGVPYVLVHLKSKDPGEGKIDMYTSSLAESHRLSSPYIIDQKDFRALIMKKMNYNGLSINWKAVADAIMYFDPNSIIHGVFFPNIEGGRIKLSRLLDGYIEAEGAEDVPSHGVNNNRVDPKGLIRAVDSQDSSVYQNIPYPNVRFTAERINGYFKLNMARLLSYGFSTEATDLLISLSLYQLQYFLTYGLELRASCDLELAEPIRMNVAGWEMPYMKTLLEWIKEDAEACMKQGVFANPPVTEITTFVKKFKEKQGKDDGKKSGGKDKESGDEDGDGDGGE